MIVNLMRSNQRWLWTAVSVIVIISFIGFYSNRTDRGPHVSDRVGTIYGRTLTVTEMQRTARQLRTANELGLINLTDRALFGGSMDEAAINHLVVLHQAQEMGIQPGGDEVLEAEKRLPAFQGANGEFDPQKYNSFIGGDTLASRGFTEGLVEELVRRDLQFGKLREIVEAPALVSPVKVRLAYDQYYGKTDASVVRLKSEDYAAGIAAPTDEEIKKYYDEHKDQLQQPERRRVQYVKFALDEAQKKLAGRERMDALTVYRDQSEQFLGKLLEQRGKADFAAVAAAEKLTPKETGEFESGQRAGFEEAAIPGFAAAAFKLTQKEPDSDVPLATADAFYDLHLAGLVKQRDLTPEEARPKVAAAIQEERTKAALTAKAEEIRTKIAEALKAGKGFADAAKEAGQTPQEVPAFSQAEAPPALRAMPDGRVIAGAAQELAAGELSKLVPTPTGGLLVFIRGRQAVGDAMFDQQKPMLAMNLQQRQGMLFFYEWLRASREAADVRLEGRSRG